MRLLVKKKDKDVNELRFGKGPVYIGRHTNSQVFLPDRAVSRQHAVIFATQEGKWMVEDLDSANKTYLNGKAIHKANLKTGDKLGIADFTIEINIEDTTEEKPINLEDTLTTAAHDFQTIVRTLDARHAPSIKMPSKRVKQFAQATEAICAARGLDNIVLALLNLMLRQFSALHCWCALRDSPQGPMLAHAGKKQGGGAAELDDLKLKDKITDALGKMHFVLLSRLPFQMEQQKLRSAMIAPVLGPDGCFGVLYVDNSTNREHYDTSDLDYLILLAVHTAAIVKNF